tara:strand:+ start:369 stop:1061 length:693 start_codon:yes stop_codon:yes gene_type:complete
MKNILARGGIEFLAVLFGISISLWVEDWRQEKDIQNKILDDYNNIRNEIELDTKNIDRIIASVQSQSALLRTLIDYSSGKMKFDEQKILKSLQSVTAPTFFGSLTSYKASVSSGRLNFSSEMDISNEISLLYEHFYKRLDTNSQIYDQRLQILKSSYFIDFYSLIHGDNNFNQNTRSLFLSDRMQNALYWILDYVENFYINRLTETRSQMINTMNSINGYLIETNEDYKK